jgi:hypothetical protein
VKLVPPLEVTDAVLVSSTVPEDDAEVWSASKYYATGDEVMVTTGVHRVYEALTGTSGVVTMTIASPCVITWPGSAPAANTPFQMSTTGALATGLVAGTTYYVKAPSGATSNVSATAGGADINTSGSQSGVHTARYGANFNKSPPSYSDPEAVSPDWLETGATNRWRLFDEVVGQQCTDTDEIEVVLAPTERCTTASLFNLDAAEVTVVVVSDSEGEVYNETFSLTDDGGITDWYSWFFSPIERLSTLVVNDLPAHSDTEVTVTITGAGTIGCGEVVLGFAREIGDTMWDTQLGINDYSYKAQDDFGNWRITQRAFSRAAQFPVWLDGSRTDAVIRLLERYRSTPVVWIGIEGTTSTYVYGFYQSFVLAMKNFPQSLYNLEIEGLT